MTNDFSRVRGFELRHRVKGKETISRFDAKEFALFKQWVDICKENRYEFEAFVIEDDDHLEPIKF